MNIDKVAYFKNSRHWKTCCVLGKLNIKVLLSTDDSFGSGIIRLLPDAACLQTLPICTNITTYSNMPTRTSSSLGISCGAVLFGFSSLFRHYSTVSLGSIVLVGVLTNGLVCFGEVRDSALTFLEAASVLYSFGRRNL